MDELSRTLQETERKKKVDPFQKRLQALVEDMKLSGLALVPLVSLEITPLGPPRVNSSGFLIQEIPPQKGKPLSPPKEINKIKP